MTTSSDPAALVERLGHVQLITLNRPDARNAVNADLSTAVGTALAEADADPEVRCVVLTGSGDKSFSAGADLKALSRGEGIHAPEHPEWGFAGVAQHHVSVPMIAAVNGTALGGGLEIALSCDLIVSADSAVFGLPEVKRGLFAAAGGVFRLPESVPRRIALEMMLTGDPISADRALELGLVNRVVPRGDLLDTAMELAERIAANAPLAVQASKRVALGLRDGARDDEAAAWSHTSAEAAAIFASADAAEGTTAFAEKRDPVWRAR